MKFKIDLLILLIIITIIIFLFLIIDKKESWSGYFYLNRDDTSNVIKSNSKFDSIDKCNQWINGVESKFNLFNNVKYSGQCRLNCKHEDEMDSCEKILQS